MSGAPPAVTRVRLTVAQPVPATRWCFLEVDTADGRTGTGEATLQAAEAAVLERAARLLPGLAGRPADPAAIAARLPADLPAAAVLSALSQAMWDLAGQRAGQPLHRLLGPGRRAAVAVYANINRRTRDRSPEGFAASARLARAAGFDAIKIAPFDEVTAAARAGGQERQAMGGGIARIAAVRAAVGPEVALMVDCHWRFTRAGAEAMIAAVAPFRLHWVECPLPERREAVAVLRALRGQANRLGMRLAGCETEVGLAGFEPYAAAGAYDVMMPDIKYVGSIEEMLAIGRRLDRAGVAFSPHNPSGPVSHAASLQLCAVVPAMERLELQFDETPLFDAIAGGVLPRPSGGASALPAGPGLGCALDPAVLAATGVLARSWP